jgi:hypothetical protein
LASTISRSHPHPPQLTEILLTHLPGAEGKFQRVGTEDAHPIGKPTEFTGGDRLRERLLTALSSECGAVLDHSVMAIVGGRDAYGHGLAFGPGQAGGTEHDGPVQAKVRVESLAIEAVGREDVIGTRVMAGGRQNPCGLGYRPVGSFLSLTGERIAASRSGRATACAVVLRWHRVTLESIPR